VYIQEAKQHMDTFLGIPAFFHRVAEKGHMIKLTVETVGHVVRMQAAQAKLEREGGLDDASNPSGQEAMMKQGLKFIWALGKLEIETTLRAVCEAVLRADNKKLRRARAKGLKLIGEIFQKVAKDMLKHGLQPLNIFDTFAPPPSPTSSASSGPPPQTNHTQS